MRSSGSNTALRQQLNPTLANGGSWIVGTVTSATSADCSTHSSADPGAYCSADPGAHGSADRGAYCNADPGAYCSADLGSYSSADQLHMTIQRGVLIETLAALSATAACGPLESRGRPEDGVRKPVEVHESSETTTSSG